jgi:hypothetical protein
MGRAKRERVWWVHARDRRLVLPRMRQIDEPRPLDEAQQIFGAVVVVGSREARSGKERRGSKESAQTTGCIEC